MSLLCCKNAVCPACLRKLAKFVPLAGGNGHIVELKHKGIAALSDTMTIRCPACLNWFIVDARTLTVEDADARNQNRSANAG